MVLGYGADAYFLFEMPVAATEWCRKHATRWPPCYPSVMFV
jgi:hypothetical protein